METMLMVDTDQLQREIAPIVQRAKDLIVNSPDTYIQANNELLVVNRYIKQADEKFDPVKEKAYETYKAAGNLKKDFLANTHLMEAKAIYTTNILKYDDEERRKQRIAQAEAEEIARKAQADAEAKAKKELKAGHTEKAQAIMANVAPVVIPQTNIPKIEGQYTKETWHAEITDISKVDRKYLIENMPLLNSLAQSSKDKIPAPAGIKFVVNKTLVNRTR